MLLNLNPTAEIESKSLWPQSYVLNFQRTGTKDLCSEMSLFQIYCMLSYYTVYSYCTVSHTICPLGQYTTVLHIATAHAPHTATRAYPLVYCAVSSEMLYIYSGFEVTCPDCDLQSAIQNSNCVSTLRTNSAHAIRILNTK